MYLEACLQQRQNFSPLVASGDGLLVVDARTTLGRIDIRLTTKWQKPYSSTCEYFQSNIAITLVQDTQHCIQGSRFPAHRISVKLLQ